MPSSWSQEKYIQAYFYAAKAFNKKPFPGTFPFDGLYTYVVHVSLVSMEIMATLQEEAGIDGDLALQCALLHDVLMDGGKKFSDLVKEFGYDVARGVKALSKNSKLPKSQQMKDSLDRIRKRPHAIWIVKMADRIVNLSTPPTNWTTKKIEAYTKEAVEIYETLKPASLFLAERLSTKIEAYEKYIE